MVLLNYAAVKNGIVLNLQTFDEDASEELLQAVAMANQVDEYIQYDGYVVIGSQFVDGKWISPQPYPSWIQNENLEWNAPVPMPDSGGPYLWDEESLSWIESLGTVNDN